MSVCLDDAWQWPADVASPAYVHDAGPGLLMLLPWTTPPGAVWARLWCTRAQWTGTAVLPSTYSATEVTHGPLAMQESLVSAQKGRALREFAAGVGALLPLLGALVSTG